MMKAIVFGATGMLGQGTVIEALASPDVESLLLVGRGPSGVTHAKAKDLIVKDLHDYAAVEDELKGYDACFFCLGITSAGMKEPDYTKITYDLTLAAAKTLLKLNPSLTFIYVSGAGTDSSEKGGSMWARVKGKTENALLKLGFKGAYMFRPGYIQPMKGIKSRTTSYRIIYGIFGPLYPLMKLMAPGAMTTTEKVGKAMIAVGKGGYSKPILDPKDINAAAG